MSTHRSSHEVIIPDKIKRFENFGKIPGWILLLGFAIIASVYLAPVFIQDFWSKPALNFNGEKITAFVAGEHASTRIKGPSANYVEVSFVTKDGIQHSSEFSVTYDYYQSLKFGDPIEIIYDPKKPERTYPIHSKGTPVWIQTVIILCLPVVVIGAIVRYKNILYLKL